MNDSAQDAVWRDVQNIPSASLETGVVEIATRLGRSLEARGLMAVTAESCTGGAIARALTETAGSSSWFDRAFITYSNQAKMDMLGVPAETLQAHGAVSEHVAAAMVRGALAASGQALALSVTGVAGPGGGSATKPVGMVCFGWAFRAGSVIRVETCTVQWPGDRHEVRLRTACYSLSRAEEWLAST